MISGNLIIRSDRLLCFCHTHHTQCLLGTAFAQELCRHRGAHQVRGAEEGKGSLVGEYHFAILTGRPAGDELKAHDLVIFRVHSQHRLCWCRIICAYNLSTRIHDEPHFGIFRRMLQDVMPQTVGEMVGEGSESLWFTGLHAIDVLHVGDVTCLVCLPPDAGSRKHEGREGKRDDAHDKNALPHIAPYVAQGLEEVDTDPPPAPPCMEGSRMYCVIVF